MILFSRVSFCLATKAIVLVTVLEPRDCRPLESCLLKCPIARHTQYDRHIQNIDISEMFNQTNPTVRTWSILGPWSLVIGHTYNTVTPTHTIDSFHSLQRSIFVLIRFIRWLIFALRAH